MNLRPRVRIALASTVPTLLALPVLCVLAAVGAMPWAVLLALPVVLVVQAAATFARLNQVP
ncbi:hypothetical protein [Streptomyces drozdowiczii]|uniref:Uncharacterized protein n=1 Tax=Streptomyces drozdowiczii TaxID=202862 RepID=A0ABY6PLZ6_9ACTN|nr:hypothetical protein [Streptomyces drozdowiczii]MCX0247415.1 hypothetical protein [Streptomyces drozdowiczii]UZK53184.1 hypothetical protein NEH16_02740 [Streptomyces drozdowiczii]